MKVNRGKIKELEFIVSLYESWSGSFILLVQLLHYMIKIYLLLTFIII